MHASILIERIVRQTTVLIAQLSTAAGIRAPLAHLADQVFVELAREIESQGVPRKVAADMFGLALRTYQRKVQRLAESATQRSTTLWVAVLDHVRQQESVSRGRLLQRFASDDPEQVAAVITDLVASGLLYASGRGAHAMYRALSAEERREVAESSELDAIAGLLWLTIYRRKAGSSVDELAAELGVESPLVQRGLAQLIADGRIEKSAAGGQDRYSAQTFLVPIGAERGWDGAFAYTMQATCDADGVLEPAAACDAGELCRISGAGEHVGCVQCIGPDVLGGNALGFLDSRCDPADVARVQSCGADNTWAASRACTSGTSCTGPFDDSCGSCTSAAGNTVVCTQTNIDDAQVCGSCTVSATLLAECTETAISALTTGAESCNSQFGGATTAWGGEPDCCDGSAGAYLQTTNATCGTLGYGVPGAWAGELDCCSAFMLAGGGPSFAYCAP